MAWASLRGRARRTSPESALQLSSARPEPAVLCRVQSGMAAPILQWDDDDLAIGELVERFGGADDLALLLSSVLPDRLLRMHSLTQGISGASVFLAYPERPDSGIPLRVSPIKWCRSQRPSSG